MGNMERFPGAAKGPEQSRQEEPDEAVRVDVGESKRLPERAVDVEEAVGLIVPYGDQRFRDREKNFESGEAAYAYGNDVAEMVGVRHTNDPESLMLKIVQATRDDYLRNTPKEQAMFMVEGMYNRDGLEPEGLDGTLSGLASESEAVKKFGEKGAMLWKAREQGVEISSPEKPQNEIIAALKEQGFSAEDLSLYLTMRQFTSEIGQPHPDSTPESAERDFTGMFMAIEESTGAGWISDATKAEIAAVRKTNDRAAQKAQVPKILSEFTSGLNGAFAKLPGMKGKALVPSLEALVNRNEGVPEDKKIPISAVNAFHDPNERNGRTNEVSAAWNGERDTYIVQQIAEAHARGKKPLVVYGGSHAIAVEPALKALGGK